MDAKLAPGKNKLLNKRCCEEEEEEEGDDDWNDDGVNGLMNAVVYS